MHIKLSVQQKDTGFHFILHITAMEYSPGYPGSGPTYSCAGEPPEPAEAYPTEGYVELDGEITITDAETLKVAMDAITQVTDNNAALFDALCVEHDEAVYEALISYKEAEYYSSREPNAIERRLFISLLHE